jgi:hypothetical protein
LNLMTGSGPAGHLSERDRASRSLNGPEPSGILPAGAPPPKKNIGRIS